MFQVGGEEVLSGTFERRQPEEGSEKVTHGENNTRGAPVGCGVTGVTGKQGREGLAQGPRLCSVTSSSGPG